MLQLLTGYGDALASPLDSLVARVREARSDPSLEALGALVDPRAGGWPLEEAAVYADLALCCADPDPEARPGMT